MLQNNRDVLVLKGVYDKQSLRQIARELQTSYENIRQICNDLEVLGLIDIDESIVKANNRIVTEDGKKELRAWRLLR